MRAPEIPALGAIALVVLGAWCLVNALTQTAFFLPILLSSGSVSRPEEYLPLLVYALSGVVLVGFRDRLAAVLFRPSSGSIEVADAQKLQSFLIALLGLWFIVDALVLGAAIEAKLNHNFSDLSADGLGGDRLSVLLGGDAWRQRLPNLVKLCAGLVLFSASGSVVRVWEKLRASSS